MQREGVPIRNGGSAFGRYNKKARRKTHFLRGYLEKQGNAFYVKSTGSQGSHILKSFAISNCLIKVPGEITHIPSGTKVKAHILPI